MSRISKKPLTVSGVMREHEDVDIRRLIHLVLDSPSLPLSEERVVSKDGKLISGPLESPDGTTSLKEFGVPAEDLEGLVAAGMEVQRLLVNNPREVTADDARKLYQEIM